jgi:perosamine synthetase
LNVILLSKEFAAQRDALLNLLHQNQIQARPAWMLMNKLPMYQTCPKMNLEKAEEIEARLINIPSSVSLGAA